MTYLTDNQYALLSNLADRQAAKLRATKPLGDGTVAVQGRLAWHGAVQAAADSFVEIDPAFDKTRFLAGAGALDNSTPLTEQEWYQIAEQELAKQSRGGNVLKDWPDSEWDAEYRAGHSPAFAVRYLLHVAEER